MTDNRQTLTIHISIEPGELNDTVTVRAGGDYPHVHVMRRVRYVEERWGRWYEAKRTAMEMAEKLLRGWL